MPVASLADACLAYGHVALLDRAELQVQPGERIALIGRNGCGKSSLLRVLAGEVALDDGTLWREAGSRVALVPQEPVFEAGHTVFEAVVAGAGETASLLRQYHLLSGRVSGDPADLERLQVLQQALDHRDGWRLDARATQVLGRLGLAVDAPVAGLSGGAQKRLALARALVEDPDLLLLDEPTNHLDVEGILWLEELLLAWRGTLLVITHDRRFLDRVATRIVELDRGRLTSFPGAFAAYQSRKAELLDAEAVASREFDKLLAQEEAWIRKGVEARRTRSAGRTARLEQLRRERAARRERLGKVDFALDRGEVSGKLVAELQNVSKHFSGRAVVQGFSTRILRGDRIGLIGPNGAGKTTLLKLILGELAPDAGSVRLGTKLAVAYFDQLRTQLDEQASLADVISPGSDYLEIEGRRQHVIGYLGDFLFAPERARSPVSSLSGGERNRLLLARLFARPANLLVLDEPTNDLDIETLELLEALLQDYPGTLLLVSHDRSFLDNVVTQTIAFEGAGRWREYAGGYADWERARPRAEEVSARKPDAAGTAKPASRARPERGPKLTFDEQRELAALPERIGTLETEQAALTARLGDPAFYRQPADEVRRVSDRLKAVEAEVSAAMARWEALETKAGASAREEK
jgi:ATP-binding cassette subfamily F protein uup